MKRINFDYELVRASQMTAIRQQSEAAPEAEEDREDGGVLPRELRDSLARLRLLEGVPFAYLVPDSELLPSESIRFFHLDREWTDSLLAGVMSVSTASSADRAELEARYAAVRSAIDEAERRVRGAGGEGAGEGAAAGPISGFLLRSRVVSGYPGMHVRGYRRDTVPDDAVVDESHPDRLRLLRLERLAPAVLLALFDGIPAVVQLEEPRVGLQFGVRLKEKDGDPGRYSAALKPRDPETGVEVPGADDVAVVFRKGSPGVLDLAATGRALASVERTGAGDGLDGAELALQMIRYPFRQVFGDG